MTDRIRTTISITPEAYEVFKRMADASNSSVSRCMGDWLADTSEAAQMVMLKMEEAKKAPMKVMREMRALVAGLGASVIEAEEEVRQKRADSDRRPPRPVAGAPLPPSSNTGGKSPTPKTPTARKVSKK